MGCVCGADISNPLPIYVTEPLAWPCEVNLTNELIDFLGLSSSVMDTLSEMTLSLTISLFTLRDDPFVMLCRHACLRLPAHRRLKSESRSRNLIYVDRNWHCNYHLKQIRVHRKQQLVLKSHWKMNSALHQIFPRGIGDFLSCFTLRTEVALSVFTFCLVIRLLAI